MERRRLFDTYNAGYVQALYETYLLDPQAVDEPWRSLFAAEPQAKEATALGVLDGAGEARAAAPAPRAPQATPPLEQLRAARAAGELVDALRLHGHWDARLDPLGSEPPGHPMLDARYHGSTEAMLAAIPAGLLSLGQNGSNMAEALAWLRERYSGTIGYEYEHLEDPERREWLRERIEGGAHLEPLTDEARRRLLDRLSEVEAMEQFLHRAYLGHKRFSVEGTDMLVPMLDLAIERASTGGAGEVVIGMAHRGRLNVLAHVLGRPHETIIAEFEGPRDGIGTGDVKYHLGAEGTYATSSGQPLTVTLAPNPSHLEFVNPVVEGIARAKQNRRNGRGLARDEAAVLPILIHGDAAFAGQGVVAETLNIARLDGYRTGGTLHLILNNQIGFTTSPSDGRSTRYASDLTRGFGTPIFHVNADDPEACLAVIRLALAYRSRFHDDVVIDLVGYRRYGHNEGDEPAYTQPVMYAKIQEHPSVRQIWAKRLADDGVIGADDAERAWDVAYARLVEAQEKARARAGGTPAKPESSPAPANEGADVATGMDESVLLAIDAELHRWPDGFNIHPKLGRQLERRANQLSDGGPVDWAHAESLALGSLLVEGTHVRLTGQDTIRGTFSQRHLAFYDTETGEHYLPLERLTDARAPFEIYNSPLSEIATMGFEYGFSTADSDALVLWEAQFGDFVNVAQVILDQFLVAGREKWGQESRLVLLLPHGYEGQGPEHSSARLERFLQLAAEDNMRVANCTLPAQYFHLLRRQAKQPRRQPLVVMTPKSLLRHPQAVSTLSDLAQGEFRPVLDDASAADRRDEVTRIVLCSGKVYYDLVGHDDWKDARHVAAIRVEELYPFPAERIDEILNAYPAAEELVWTQEEPRNMGAWQYAAPRLRRLAGDRLRVAHVGRPERASPAEGYASAHAVEQKRIVEDALGAPVAGKRDR